MSVVESIARGGSEGDRRAGSHPYVITDSLLSTESVKRPGIRNPLRLPRGSPRVGVDPGRSWVDLGSIWGRSWGCSGDVMGKIWGGPGKSKAIVLACQNMVFK